MIHYSSRMEPAPAGCNRRFSGVRNGVVCDRGTLGCYIKHEPLYTDMASHHIEGHALAAQSRGIDSYFNVPLISHIDENLWMGGCRQGVHLPTDFKYVISLYPWEKYVLPDGCERHEFKLYDAGEVPDEDTLNDIADLINECAADGKTLVHCQAGLNRSGLTTALALVKQGLAPEDAISLLRERRCDLVLCNETFEAWLREQVAVLTL